MPNRCVCCGEIIPEGRMVCPNCENSNGPILKVETSFYDKVETFPNCTVQVLTNTVTGDVSVGWWKNEVIENGK